MEIVIHIPKAYWDDSWGHVKLLAHRCSVSGSTKVGRRVHRRHYCSLLYVKEWLVLCLLRGFSEIMVPRAVFRAGISCMKSALVIVRKLMLLFVLKSCCFYFFLVCTLLHTLLNCKTNSGFRDRHTWIYMANLTHLLCDLWQESSFPGISVCNFVIWV